MRELSVIEDGSVLISNGIIRSVGPTRRIENLAEARAAEEIDATGRIVMPGFNDPHVNLVGPPARSLEYPQGSDAASITASEMAQAAFSYLKNTPPVRLEFHARRIVQRSVRHGTTSLEAKCGYGLDETSEIKALRAVANSGGCANLIPSYVASASSTEYTSAKYSEKADLYLKWVCAELLPKVRRRNMVAFAEISCDPDGFTLDQARTFLVTAGRLGFLLKLQAEQTTRMGAVRLAVEMDARSISGLNFCDQFDADMLSRSRTVAVVMPARELQSHSAKLAPARLLIDSGVAVALASGFRPALPGTYSMQSVLSLACTDFAMTPEEAISAATINAAHAMNRAAISGSLEFGKEADLIMLDVSDYREIPYHLGVNHIEMTMRKGEVVYREGTIACSGQ
jgi:imidazolonepropionase